MCVDFCLSVYTPETILVRNEVIVTRYKALAINIMNGCGVSYKAHLEHFLNNLVANVVVGVHTYDHVQSLLC